MVERHWKGIAKAEEANNYIDHLTKDTFPQLAAIKGFVNASILTREVNEGIEFLIVTVWQSIEAIKQFAGEQVDAAVVPSIVQQMMITYDKNVRHYERLGEYYPANR